MAMTKDTPPGHLLVIAAPSGAGKTSLVKALLDSTTGIAVSVSHTTREKRPGEQDGVDYHFVDKARFETLLDAGDFIEHARVFDNYYGTSGQAVADQLVKGSDVILEIDWQGARQVAAKFPECTRIFILPPSTQALRERLTDRGQDDDNIIERRMRDAVAEMSHYAEFDYLVINDKFDTALDELRTIIAALRLRRATQSRRHQSLLEALLQGK
jgi:guanylate kinase